MADLGTIDLEAVYNGDKDAIGDAVRYFQQALHGSVQLIGGSIVAPGEVNVGGDINASGNITAHATLGETGNNEPSRVEIGAVDAGSVNTAAGATAGIRLGGTGAQTDVWLLSLDIEGASPDDRTALLVVNETDSRVGPSWMYDGDDGLFIFGPRHTRTTEQHLGSSNSATTRWDQLHIDVGGTFQGGRSIASGVWTTYTPTLAGSGAAVGNGTITGRYTQIDNTVHFRIALIFGSTTTLGTGPTFTLPVTSLAYGNAVTALGSCLFYDSGSGAWYVGTARYDSTTTVVAVSNTGAATGTVANTVPFTWATDDQLGIEGTYQIS